jgi:hypothetical protein
MKKLKLELESLAVESFEPRARDAGGRGTVAGNEMEYISFTCVPTVIDCGTIEGCLPTLPGCGDTKWDACGHSFGGTCEA